VYFEVDHTLVNPKVKVNLAIPYTVVTDFYVRDAALLAAPLCKGFNRKPGYLGNLSWREQLRSRNEALRLSRGSARSVGSEFVKGHVLAFKR
jgi:hypothetical protein